MSAEQLQRLAESLGEYSLMPYRVAVLPLRWGEVAGLRLGRIDFLRQTIT